MSEIIIGIDFGTTNSEVAIVEQGKVKIIEHNGQKILPSFVGIDQDHKVIVGEKARNQYLLYPERTVKSIKRLMGQDIRVNLADQSFTPQEISAIILKTLKQTAENYLGKPVSKAVITVPAYFSDTQRQATREAGEIAGLEVVRMINEPTAAALNYGAAQDKPKKMLVYDLGGGTFDVSVVNVESGVVEVLSSHGDNHLGGDDFDQQIIKFMLDHITKTYQIDASADIKAMARITRAAEDAKLVLSDQPYVQIEEEYLLERQGSPIHLSVELSRAKYEDMIEAFINATLEAVHIALKGAKIACSDIDEIILVGGSTRTPCIRERLFSEFGFEPHAEIDPDLCVAMGAAIQAAMMAGEKVESVLVHVTPYAYGTSALGILNGESYPFVYVPVIHKNSTLPIRKTEAFTTSYDGQEFVDINIFQGEDADALNNTKIGEFQVTGLKNAKAGHVITLTLDLDLSGVLHVSAQEKQTGMEKSILIKEALSRFEGETLEKAKQRVTSMFGQMDTRLFDEDKLETEQADTPEIKAARELISKAKMLLEQVSNEDKKDITELVKTISNLIESGDLEGLDNASTQLSDIIYYLES
jgi:molecular chaperone DnaK (HSP70)